MVNKAYKTELRLNNKQRNLCRMHSGTSRFAYNWGLERIENVCRLNQLPVPSVKYPNAIDLYRELIGLKEDGTFGWLSEVSKWSPQEALRDLDMAFKHFFRRLKSGEGELGYPRFKSRKDGMGSFTLRTPIIVVDDRIRLPRIGWVRLKERGYIPMGRWSQATISERAGRWFVSVLVKEEVEPSHNLSGVVGVDLGIKSLAVCSDGTVFENPKALESNLRKLRRQQKAVSRKKKGSKNRKKAVRELQRTYLRISNIRHDNLHKTTCYLAKNKLVIGLEDLNVGGMLKNHHLARAISDVGLGEFRRQMEYKSGWYGSTLVFADRWYPSSKTCCKCGHLRDDLKLSERTFVCPSCGNSIDRDYNASLNLEMVAMSSIETLNACGEESSSPLLGVKLSQ